MKRRPVKLAALLLAGVCWTTPARAAEVLMEPQIPTALALEAAAAAVEACRADGYLVTAAVVDNAGHVKVALRADGAGPHTLDSARRKAYTALSTRQPTSALVEVVVKHEAARSLGDIDDFLILGGGMPIAAGDRVVGAIGVGGAPGGHLDDACAEAGIAAIRDKL